MRGLQCDVWKIAKLAKLTQIGPCLKILCPNQTKTFPFFREEKSLEQKQTRVSPVLLLQLPTNQNPSSTHVVSPPIKPRPHDPDVIRIDAALYKESTVERKSSASLLDIHTDSGKENQIPDPVQQQEVETQTSDVINGQDTPGKRQVVVQQQRNKNQPITIKKPHLENRRETLDGPPTRSRRPPKLKPKRPPLPKDGLPVSEELIVASQAEPGTPQTTSIGNSLGEVTSRENTSLDANHWIVPQSETQIFGTPSAGTLREKPKRPPPPRGYPSRNFPRTQTDNRLPESLLPNPLGYSLKVRTWTKLTSRWGCLMRSQTLKGLVQHHPVPDFEEAIEEVLEEDQVKRLPYNDFST